MILQYLHQICEINFEIHDNEMIEVYDKYVIVSIIDKYQHSLALLWHLTSSC